MAPLSERVHQSQRWTLRTLYALHDDDDDDDDGVCMHVCMYMAYWPAVVLVALAWFLSEVISTAVLQ